MASRPEELRESPCGDADPTEPVDTDHAGRGEAHEVALAGLGHGRRLGRYTLLDLLGRGGMGVVFTAYDEELDRKVAIKFVPRASDPRARAMLLAEAQALARLAHPNVIHVYEVGEVGEAGDRVFIAMEFVRGQTLRQWLQTQRPWPEVVAMFLQAGRGLSAAHQAGLVHCDFKPDNALVGHDGRLRVLDFGLARRQEEPRSDEGPAAVRGGTPAYMSPEHFAGDSLDARSDQFSLCVALWEALYGQRPFAGETLPALMTSVLQGELRTAAGEAKVPARLRRALRRGLARDPAERHASTAALLAELAESLPRPRGAWWIAAFASALLTSAAWAIFLRGDDPAAACAADLAAELAPIWGEGPRAAVERAFVATGLPYARDSFERSTRLIDAYAHEWSTLRQRTCELARSSPGAASRLRARCLERRRHALAAWVDALALADATVVEQAVEASADLPSPRPCAEPSALLAEDEPGPDDETEALLARARAQLLAGQYERGLAPALAARERARRLGLPRLEAEALLQTGLLHEHTGEGAAAADSFAAAYFIAEAARHHAARAEAATHLVHVTGGPPRPPEADALWSRLAESIAAGLGEGALDLRAALLQHRSRNAIAARRLGDARADLEAALELETHRLGDGHPALASIHEQLGEALLLAGRLDDALVHHERALAVAEANLGPDHPSTARRLLGRGRVHERRGDLEAALRDDLRALAIWERAYGEHPRLIWALTSTGRALHKSGQPARAEPYYARAAAIAGRSQDPADPAPGHTWIELAEVVGELGRADEARELRVRALAALRVAPGDPDALIDLGEAFLADDDPARARDAIARARELHGPDAPRDQQARAAFALARALAAAGDLPRARPLAVQALADYRAAGSSHGAALLSIETWLAEHP